jgi:hypothetical protein
MNKKEILQQLMLEDNLTPDSEFYRYTKKSHIIEHRDGSLTITANSNPPEMIIDLYDGQGHTFRADSVGQGLSFTTKEEQDYRTDETVSVKLKLKDILDQGGLIYKVISLPEYVKAYYFTIPSGKVKIQMN